MSNFSREDISSLTEQHSSETGQQFERDALELVWDYTRGQPWLVIFDRTPAGRQKSWEERLTWQEVETENGLVTVVGG